MLKFIMLSRCTFSTMVSSQPLPRNIRTPIFNSEDIKAQLLQHRKENSVYKLYKDRQIVLRIREDKINDIKSILEKFNIDTSQLRKDKRIFKESAWTIEKRIMLLQELGVPKVTTNLIVNFVKAMHLSVNMFKANTSISSDTNLAKNLFSYVENLKIDYNDVNDLNEHLPMKTYYANCFAHYLINEFDENADQIKILSCKRHKNLLYNSFTLLQRMLKFLKNDLKFNDSLIVSNFLLFGEHPGHAEAISDILKNDLKVPLSILLKYPQLLYHDITDLKTLVKYFKQYGFTPKMISNYYQVLQLTSVDFKRRMETLLNNPFTLVYQKHPRFLILVKHHNTILPRIRYLQEKNMKYATINSLTSFHSYLENLVGNKKTTKMNLKSFCETLFGNDAKELLVNIKRHPCYTYVSLVQMYETYIYLKEHFSKKVIYKQIYAILYNKVDVEAAYENVIKDPHYSKLPSHQLLALCIYKIEERCHFTGDGVLTPEKYAEMCNEDFNQDKTLEDDKKE